MVSHYTAYLPIIYLTVISFTHTHTKIKLYEAGIFVYFAHCYIQSLEQCLTHIGRDN